MEQVCKDLDGVSWWYYDPATSEYSRRLPSGDIDTATGGKLLAHLAGRDVPNPDALWQRRCDRAGVDTSSAAGQRMKPTATTYALWTHWQGVNNA